MCITPSWLKYPSKMTIIIDNIKLDKDNVEFNNADEFVQHTYRLIYLTGKTDTGKTTFLKYIKKITNKNTIVVAPTGSENKETISSILIIEKKSADLLISELKRNKKILQS